MVEFPGDGHHCMKVDVSNEADIKHCQQYVHRRFGTSDVIINSVGISDGRPFLFDNIEEWDRSIQIMLYGAVKTCRALVPLINAGGRIIQITSIHYEG